MCNKLTLGSILVFLLFYLVDCSIPQEFEEFGCAKDNCKSVLYSAIIRVDYSGLKKGSQVNVVGETEEECMVKSLKGDKYHVVKKEFIQRTRMHKSYNLMAHSGIHPATSKIEINHESSSGPSEPSKPSKLDKTLKSTMDHSGPGLESEEFVSDMTFSTKKEVNSEHIHLQTKIPDVYSSPSDIFPSIQVSVSNTLESTTLLSDVKSINGNKYPGPEKTELIPSEPIKDSMKTHPPNLSSKENNNLGPTYPKPADYDTLNNNQVSKDINIKDHPIKNTEMDLDSVSSTNVSESASKTNTSKSAPTANISQSTSAANSSQATSSENISKSFFPVNNSGSVSTAKTFKSILLSYYTVSKANTSDSDLTANVVNSTSPTTIFKSPSSTSTSAFVANKSESALAPNTSESTSLDTSESFSPANNSGSLSPTNISESDSTANISESNSTANISESASSANMSESDSSENNSESVSPANNSESVSTANNSGSVSPANNSESVFSPNNSKSVSTGHILESESMANISESVLLSNNSESVSANTSSDFTVNVVKSPSPTSTSAFVANNSVSVPATKTSESSSLNSSESLSPAIKFKSDSATEVNSDSVTQVQDSFLTNNKVLSSSTDDSVLSSSPDKAVPQSGFVQQPQRPILPEIQRYGADQPPTDKFDAKQVSHKISQRQDSANNIISDLKNVDFKETNEKIPGIKEGSQREKPVSHIEILKPGKIDSSAEHFFGETENSFFLETWEELKNGKITVLLNYFSNEIASGPLSQYPSFIILMNTVLFLLFILMMNCLSIRKCNNSFKGKLYMCEKKLLEHNVENVNIQELVEEKNKTFLFCDKLKEENLLKKNQVDLLTSKIDELKEHEKNLTASLNEYKSKYQSLEEMSNKKNIKKNYEKLMDQVKVQKDKLDELAAGMEERAEILRKEKENVETLLSLQAEEHSKIINDYRILLNNVELENTELREIVQTMSVDSDVGEKLLQGVKLQVQLSDLEKENINLNHQLEGEREAHKLLEDHQRITQKEVNDLRESYEIVVKEKSDLNNKLKYITDYFQQLEDKLKKEIAEKDELLNEKLGDDDSLAKALMNLRKENCVLNEENNILRAKYDSLKVELTDQKNEEKLSKTKLESEREQIWMDWRAAERKIESLNLDNKVLRSKLVAMGSKSESSFREMHTQTYDDPDKILSPTSSLFMDHTSPVPQPAFFIPSYAIPPPPLSDEEMRQLYGPSNNYNQHGYHSDEEPEHSYDHRLPPLGGTFSPPTLDNIPVPNIPLPLDNEHLWRRQTWNSQDISSNEEEAGTQHKSYSRRRTGDSVSSVSSSKRSFV